MRIATVLTRKFCLKRLIWTIILVVSVSALYYMRRYPVHEDINPFVQIRASELRHLYEQRGTLDLAVEFGFDPLIVRIVSQLSTNEMRLRACKCPTWRFVKTDRDLAYLILSIIQAESRGDYRAFNPGGPAYGLTQLVLSTARMYDKDVHPTELLTIPKNLSIAVKHFVDLLERFSGNYTLAVLAWNRGSNGVERSLALGNSPDNGYARAVFTQAALRNAN